jgi:hypothetical protein
MIVGNPGLGAAIRRPDVYTKLHIRFDNESNNFIDLTGKAIYITGNPYQVYPGKFVGKSGYFNGSSSISCGAASDYSFITNPTQFTIEISVKYIASLYTVPIIQNNNGSWSNLGFGLEISGSGNIALDVSNGASANIIHCVSSNAIYPNDYLYHTISITHDQTLPSNNTNIYLDSLLVKTATKTGVSPNTGNPYRELCIGGYTGWGFLNGYIDELRLSSIVRNKNEFIASMRR